MIISTLSIRYFNDFLRNSIFKIKLFKESLRTPRPSTFHYLIYALMKLKAKMKKPKDEFIGFRRVSKSAPAINLLNEIEN